MTSPRQRPSLVLDLPWLIATAFRAAPLDAFLTAITSVLQGFVPAVNLLILQRLIDAASRGIALTALRPVMVRVAGALLAVEIINALSRAATTRLLIRVAPAVQGLVLTKTARLPVSELERPEVHDLIARANKQTDSVTRVTLRTLGLLSTVVRVATATAVVAALSLPLAIVTGLIGVPLAWQGIRQSQRLHAVERAQTENRRRSDYFAGLVTGRSGAGELRAYQLVPFFIDRWRHMFDQYWCAQLQTRRSVMREGLAADVISLGLFAAAIVVAVRAATADQLIAGRVVTLIGGVRLLQESLAMLATDLRGLLDMGLPALDIRAFLDRSADDDLAAGRLPCPGGDICFESVTFAYPGQAPPVLDRVSFVIREGERVALVGPNGAGKTTLVKLLLGLYRPSSGRITVGGADLCDIAPAALRAHASCVFQDFARLDLTLADNITACAPDVDPASIPAACAAVGLTDMLAALPQGVETQLGKTFSAGVELSGGQWQRIALARAFARDARLVVLDEPTAALDPLAELEVYAHFAELMAGRTTVLISHRLGAARLSERIMVLDRGRIVEDGSHSELIAARGLYASLFRTQAGWYQEVVQ